MDEINNKKFELSDRVFALALILVLAIFVFIIAGAIYEFKSLPENTAREISVSGEGKVYAKPDIALVSLGVKTEAVKSQDAVNDNNKIMAQVIKAVKDAGVEEKDIQTTTYNLSPNYDWTEKGRIFRGYSLDQAISVKIRNFDKINNILDGATTAGANTVGDLQFTIDDEEKVLSEARTQAIAKAKIKAENIAKESGLKLVKLLSVYDSNYYPMSSSYAKGAGIMANEASYTPDIQTGQIETNITVTLTYRVR